MKPFLNYIILFFSSYQLIAQDIKKDASSDLLRIRQAYDHFAAISMNVNYSFYPTYTSNEPVETHTGYYSKQGKDNSRMELYGTLTVSNKELIMVKDDSSMLFMVKKYIPQDAPQLTHEQFEKLLTVCSAVEKASGAGENTGGYRLLFQGNTNGLSKIEFFFNTHTYLLTKFIMYYNNPQVTNYQSNKIKEYEKPKMEVQYKNINTNPVFDAKEFSLGKYLKKEKDKWQLTPAYVSSYELYDQTNTSASNK